MLNRHLSQIPEDNDAENSPGKHDSTIPNAKIIPWGDGPSIPSLKDKMNMIRL